MNFLKLSSKIRIDFRLGIMSFLLLLGCGTQSFQFKIEEPIRLEPLDADEPSVPDFIGEGHGFIWTDCRSANDSAIQDLMSQAKSKGFEAVSDLKWYDFQKNNWIKEPTCRTEYGWLLGTVYTLWWPEATKVKVQARGLKTEVIADSVKKDLFKSKIIGRDEIDLNSSESRQLHPNDSTFALGFMYPVVVGANFRIGHFVEANKRWALNLEMAGPLHGNGNGYLSNWGILATRFEYFLGNSFYFGLGPGFSIQNFVYSGYATSKPTDSPKLKGAWSTSISEILVGIDFGLGNEWRTSSGLIAGCEWFGGFWGRPVKREGNEYRDGTRMPMAFSPRVLACYMGSTF